jgi:hypothetical protein
MRTYKLKYKYGEGDGAPKTFIAERPVEVGEIIELENGMWHGIMNIRSLKSGIQLVLAKSDQSEADARRLLQQSVDD